MAIGSVILKGSYVYVYDEKGHQLSSKNVGSNAELRGYTATSYSVQKGNYVYVYDEKGRQLSSKHV